MLGVRPLDNGAHTFQHQGKSWHCACLLRYQRGEIEALLKYTDDAKRACGDERVAGEPLAQVIERAMAELRALRADLDERERLEARGGHPAGDGYPAHSGHDDWHVGCPRCNAR